jgi:hypothetical protein
MHRRARLKPLPSFKRWYLLDTTRGADSGNYLNRSCCAPTR